MGSAPEWGIWAVLAGRVLLVRIRKAPQIMAGRWPKHCFDFCRTRASLCFSGAGRGGAPAGRHSVCVPARMDLHNRGQGGLGRRVALAAAGAAGCCKDCWGAMSPASLGVGQAALVSPPASKPCATWAVWQLPALLYFTCAPLARSRHLANLLPLLVTHLCTRCCWPASACSL